MTNRLCSFDISLHNLHGPLPVSAVRAKALNGLFYTEMGRRFPAWVDRLHLAQGNQPLPFSLSLLYADGYVKGFRICTLQGEITRRVEEVWAELALIKAEVRLGSAQTVITGFAPGYPGATTYAQLLDSAPEASSVALRFVTPTRFKWMGHETLLPVPKAVWRSYAIRWETYSDIPLPPGFLEWVEWQVDPSEVHLETCLAYIEKEVEWKGVVGDVTYRAYLDARDVPPSRQFEYLRAWQALAALAEFSGTGEKVARGMGCTIRTRVYGHLATKPEYSIAG